MSEPVVEVSVLIPAYNVARFLPRAVRSALDQKGVVIEVIIVDDASTDGTADVAAQLAADDPRVRVLLGASNRGSAVARNIGAAAACGTWIAVLDADDAYRPGRLRRLLDVARDAELDCIADLPVFHDLTAGEDAPGQLPADGALERLDLPRFVRAAVSPESPLDYGLLKPMFRRRLVADGVWRYPETARHGEDFLAKFHALRLGTRFGVLHEAHYVFSTRLGARSGAFSPGSVTAVNYRRIAADTQDLIAEVEGDGLVPSDDRRAEVLALLRARIDKCHDLNRRYGWTTLRRGAWERHLTWLRQDVRNVGSLLRMAGTTALAGRWLTRWLKPRRS